MPLRLNGFLGDVLTGFLNTKGNMGDFNHAARLYAADTFRLAPKTKFLYYAVFNINPIITQGSAFQDLHRRELNYLVKKMDLPKFTLNTENLNQYNRKTTTYTKITYEPITLTFHDDNNGITNSMWALYYGHYFKDRLNSPNPSAEIFPEAYQNNTYQNKSQFPFRYGLDANAINRDNVPFFHSIQLFTLTKQRFFSYLLANPKITSWQHDTMDQSDGSGVVENSMTLAYDAVIYNSGQISFDQPRDFAELHYDTVPSPIAGEEILINGAEGIFGELMDLSASVFSGIGDVISSSLGLQSATNSQGNPSSYGYGTTTNLSTLGENNSTSGLQNFFFGNTSSGLTGSSTSAGNYDTGVANYSPLLNMPVDSNYDSGAATRSSIISNEYSGISTPPQFASGYLSDAYVSNLPSNLSGATESNRFNNTTSIASLNNTFAPINSSNFSNSISSTSPSTELIQNNPNRPNSTNPFA